MLLKLFYISCINLFRLLPLYIYVAENKMLSNSKTVRRSSHLVPLSATIFIKTACTPMSPLSKRKLFFHFQFRAFTDLYCELQKAIVV